MELAILAAALATLAAALEALEAIDPIPEAKALAKELTVLLIVLA